jgi:hypothetical protein
MTDSRNIAARRQAQKGNERSGPADHVAPASPAGTDLQARTGPPKASGKTNERGASRTATITFSCAMLAILAVGFWQRDDSWIEPKDGIGYWLGVAGSLIMLSLLAYSKRKSAALQWLGSVTGVFKMHMVLGIVGPVLIALHSGFFLRSVNSTVAVTVMCLVVFSGILGRYLYAKLHMGLYGNKASALLLLRDADAFQRSFGDGLDDAAPIQLELSSFTQEVLPEPGSIIGSIQQAWLVGRRSTARHFRLMVEAEAIIAAQALRQHWPADDYQHRITLAEKQLDAYFASLKKAATLRVYERIFAFWHVFHLPLFYLLICTVLAHVFAVHWY